VSWQPDDDIKLHAERKAGELLAKMELKAGRPGKNNTCTLQALDIEATQSSRWQAEAKVPTKAQNWRRCHQVPSESNFPELNY